VSGWTRAGADEGDAPPTMPIDPVDFRQALGRFASGVTVVTFRDGERVRGITVSAFLSLSLDPPLVGISIDEGARAHPLALRAERFGVSILAEGQQGVSDCFAGRVDVDDDPFEHLGSDAVIRGALAKLSCRVVQRVATGDHTLVVGEIEALEYDEAQPLVYFRGAYRRLGERDAG
jgi:flavin reductase (DIM6/NTAB) family NADH-FMN oxidoreductase RutF